MSWDTTLSDSIGIIGAGPAGLISAHVLTQDSFTNIRVITRDATVRGVWARGRVDPDLRLNKYDNCLLLSETNGSTRFQVFMENTDSLQWQWHHPKLLLGKDISLVPTYAITWRSIITCFWGRKWSLASTLKYWKYPVNRMESGLCGLRISKTIRQTRCSFAESLWLLVWVIWLMMAFLAMAFSANLGNWPYLDISSFTPRAVANPKSQPIFPLSQRSNVSIAELWFTLPSSKQT